jgi:hypothetical protein
LLSWSYGLGRRSHGSVHGIHIPLHLVKQFDKIIQNISLLVVSIETEKSVRCLCIKLLKVHNLIVVQIALLRRSLDDFLCIVIACGVDIVCRLKVWHVQKA